MRNQGVSGESPTKKPPPAQQEIQSIYNGREWLADIKPRGGTFIAQLPDGVSLGPFPDQRAATDAVHEHVRSLRRGAS